MTHELSHEYELETVGALPRDKQQYIPSLAERKQLQVRSTARLCVLKNGAEYVYPWVTVVEVTPTGYVGEVGGVCNSEDWLEYGTRVAFTADHIIEI
jgi:hypothetical protein